MQKIAYIDEYWDNSDFKNGRYVERYLENLSILSKLRERYDLKHLKGLNNDSVLELWEKRKKERYESIIVDFPLGLSLYLYQRDFSNLEKRKTNKKISFIDCSVRLGFLRDIYELRITDKIILFKDYIDGVRPHIKIDEYEINHVLERSADYTKDFFKIVKCLESNI